MEKSPAIQLIEFVWKNARDDSWRVYNASLQTALSLAISSGMEFYQDDFKYISENFRFGYWGGNDGHMLGEGYYSRIVNYGNIKAAQSFELWKKRKPFIVDNARHGRYNSTSRARDRLAIGSGFIWENEKVTVTSFSSDGSHFVACSHKEQKPDDYVRKVKHQYKITIKDIRAEKKRLKELREIEKEG